ncbi:MAG: ATP-binding cassette domain-containing protein [Anaerolineales bacterium]|nr:ATP-binding cassette domain-containing protein [Anaerolineales bacterium]
MIKTAGISKSYGSIQALNDVSFSIGEGEIVGLLGPNGAGKTTTIKILTGYLQPDNGSVSIDGLDVLAEPKKVQSRIGYLPETAPLYPELSIQSYLAMMADLRGIPEERQQRHISEAVYAAGLEKHLTRQIGELSKGFRQRVGLAQAILHLPKLLILDEPTIGLDPTQIVEIRSLIRRLSKVSTILFSTHILSEVEALCDRAIILINGQVRADAYLSELASSSDAILVLEKNIPGAAGRLEALEGVEAVSLESSREGHAHFRIHGEKRVSGSDLCPLIYNLAHENNWPLRELQHDARTLETVFNELATAV